jgi:hypothetical protein
MLVAVVVAFITHLITSELVVLVEVVLVQVLEDSVPVGQLTRAVAVVALV